ncbi:hypothetical protein Are01nite_61000 [Actinoplanes regularis]|nr:hypothetical protein Are01nite_61000 [Actinoplanes regularis]
MPEKVRRSAATTPCTVPVSVVTIEGSAAALAVAGGPITVAQTARATRARIRPGYAFVGRSVVVEFTSSRLDILGSMHFAYIEVY